MLGWLVNKYLFSCVGGNDPPPSPNQNTFLCLSTYSPCTFYFQTNGKLISDLPLSPFLSVSCRVSTGISHCLLLSVSLSLHVKLCLCLSTSNSVSAFVSLRQTLSQYLSVYVSLAPSRSLCIFPCISLSLFPSLRRCFSHSLSLPLSFDGRKHRPRSVSKSGREATLHVT